MVGATINAALPLTNVRLVNFISRVPFLFVHSIVFTITKFLSIYRYIIM